MTYEIFYRVFTAFFIKILIYTRVIKNYFFISDEKILEIKKEILKIFFLC